MKRLAVLLALVASPALAQQQPDPALQQKIIMVLQEQRNRAQDEAALLAARATILADDLAKAQARIKELEPKPSDEKKE